MVSSLLFAALLLVAVAVFLRSVLRLYRIMARGRDNDLKLTDRVAARVK